MHCESEKVSIRKRNERAPKLTFLPGMHGYILEQVLLLYISVRLPQESILLHNRQSFRIRLAVFCGLFEEASLVSVQLYAQQQRLTCKKG